MYFYYFIFSIILLFGGTFFLTFFFSKRYNIRHNNEVISIKKKKTVLITNILSGILFLNFLLVLLFSDGIGFHLLILIPCMGGLFWIEKRAIMDYLAIPLVVINLKEKYVLIGQEKTLFSDITEIEFRSLRKGRSREYSMNLFCGDKKQILITTTVTKEANLIHTLLAEKTDIYMTELIQKGILSPPLSKDSLR